MNYKRLFIPNSLIFITVVTKNRKQILIDNIEYLKTAFKLTKQKYSFDIIAIIINKDHFHTIIKPQDINLYPKIIGSIKSTFTKISGIDYSKNNSRESDIWQRRYWEHTIITEEDLYRHIDYIHYTVFLIRIPPLHLVSISLFHLCTSKQLLTEVNQRGLFITPNP